MASTNKGILAVFQYLDDFCKALEKMKDRADFRDAESFSPTSYHEIEHSAHLAPSPVRFFTLCGALTGTVTGFSLALLCDWDWPVVVGGKTAGIYSLPAYVVLGFEFTILFGAIATVIGVLVMSRIPNPKIDIIDPRLTDDRFGVFVPGVDTNSPQAALLKECGAQEVIAK
jgi:molybdopterin-containing oxidoreductase family membrane subunit